MRYRLTEDGPVVSPVTVDDAKGWLDLAHDEDDDLLSALLVGLSEQIEDATGLALSSRTFTYEARVMTRRWATGLILPLGPVTAVTSVTRYDSEGTATELVADEDYWSESDQLVFGAGHRLLTPGQRFEIIFTAGFAEASDVPQAVKMELLRRAKDAYEIPGNVLIGLMASRPRGLDFLLPYRRVRV